MAANDPTMITTSSPCSKTPVFTEIETREHTDLREMLTDRAQPSNPSRQTSHHVVSHILAYIPGNSL